MRSQLIPQFLWSGLQAIEKYLKYVLLINRIEATDISHDLSKGMKRIADFAPFQLKLSDNVLAFIEHLDTFGRHRYFETMYHYKGDDLIRLDKAVWEVRRYCQIVDWTVERPGGKTWNRMDAVLKSIDKATDAPPQKFRIHGGMLEKILDKTDHPSRPALIWQNAYYCSRTRNTVSLPGWSGFSNSPLALRPQMVDAVRKYVYLPKDVVHVFRQEAVRREKQRKQQSRKKIGK